MDNNDNDLHQKEDSTQLSLKSEEKDIQPAGFNLTRIWDNLLRFGLGGTVMRLGTGIISLILIILVVVVLSRVYAGGIVPGAQAFSGTPTAQITPILPTLQPMTGAGGAYQELDVSDYPGITRSALLHTLFPVRPRTEVITYTVVKGDTVFGIATKFNLDPETILWGNTYTLGDDPHRLSPGQELNILPVNGTYYEWHAGDGLNGVSEAYGVTPEEIINWPGNNLSLETIGDFANPKIAPGTWIFVPGGSRGFVTWSAPRISREDPAVAKFLGPGACGQIMDGPVGIGTYVWPTTDRFISGYPYSPELNHAAIDIGGNLGNAIYTVDNGVVVYAGWNDYGYGNMVVVDHGFGWQSLYAHLDSLNVACGSYVYQGGVIGYMGSTGNSSGPHLHFELLSETYGKVNPLNFLQ